jgi:hypothetical protein
MTHKPMRIRVGAQQRRLKENQAGDPHSGRAAQYGDELLGHHRFDKEQQECGEKDHDSEEEPGSGHSAKLD